MACMMNTYPLFSHNADNIPISESSSQFYEAFDASLSVDHSFETRTSPYQDQISQDDQTNAQGSPYTQSWWEGSDSNNSNISVGYFPPIDYPVYQDNFPPWDSGIPSISAPQSLRSSVSDSIPSMGCFTSPPLPHEDIPVAAVDNHGGYPAQGHANIDPPSYILNSQRLGVPSPYEPDFEHWDGSQSDRQITPDAQWPGLLSANPIESPRLQSRSKRRPSSISGVRKSLDKRASSVPGRNPRRQRLTKSSQGDNTSPRVFVCSFAPYGCESTFVSKNEWKRHTTSQHLQLGFYRCDVGKCSLYVHQTSSSQLSPPSTSPTTQVTSSSPLPAAQPNDFNRKDLFTQHQRRMHAPWLTHGRRRTPTRDEHLSFESSLEEVRRRCWHGLRQPPQQSHCGFCREVFTGEGSWEVRMEHVGRHFERDERSSLGKEVEDLSLREWGLKEGILTDVDGECRLASLVKNEVNIRGA